METEGSVEPLEQVSVKCEIIELSDEEVTLLDDVEKQIEPTKKKRIKKKPDPSKYVQCEKCAKRFPEKCQLRRHMIVHTHDRPYVCSQCGKSYRQRQHLKFHEMGHFGLTKNFTCTTCGNAFARKSSLRTHEKIHTNERAFKCHICPKSFVQKCNLVLHVKMHQGDRQFECDVCLKKFITKTKMKQHQKKHIRKSKKELARLEQMREIEGDICADSETINSTSPLWGSQFGGDVEDSN